MPRWAVVGCALAALVWVSTPVAAIAEWGYTNNGTADWPKNYPDCGLPSQSPVMLDRYKSTWLTSSFENVSKFDGQLYNYMEPCDATLMNNGHIGVVQLNYNDPETSPRLVTRVDNGIDQTSYLKSINFHWPSEHVLDNKRYAVEVQMVHVSNDGRISILSYLFEFCNHTREGLDLLGEAAVKISEAGSSAPVPRFVPQSIMPYGYFTSLRMCDYIVYKGSLTTPPCTPSVRWLVYSRPQCVAAHQLAHTWFDSNGVLISENNRPLQPDGERDIFYKSCDNV